MGVGRGVASGGGDKGEAPVETLMAQLMKDDTTADCVIVVDGREFLCHKCILATASAVFRTMLYKEGVKQWECRIKLDGLSAAGWDILHNYCYMQSYVEDAWRASFVGCMSTGGRVCIAVVGALGHESPS